MGLPAHDQLIRPAYLAVDVAFTRDEYYEILVVKWLRHRKTWKRKGRCPQCAVAALYPVKRGKDIGLKGFFCTSCGWALFKNKINELV